MTTQKFWFVVARFYLLLKSLFRSKKTLLYLIALVVIIQLFFLIALTVRTSRLEKDFDGFRNYSATTLNQIYTQVWLLNSKFQQEQEDNQ